MIQGLPFKMTIADTGYFSVPDLVQQQKALADAMLTQKLKKQIMSQNIDANEIRNKMYPLLQQSMIYKNNAMGQSRGYRDNLYAQKVQAEIANALANKNLREHQIDLVGENIKSKKMQNEYLPDTLKSKIEKSKTDNSKIYDGVQKLSQKDKLKLNNRYLMLNQLKSDIVKFAEKGAPYNLSGLQNIYNPSGAKEYNADVSGLADRIAKALNYQNTILGLQGAYNQLERGKLESDNHYKNRILSLASQVQDEINITNKLRGVKEDTQTKKQPETFPRTQVKDPYTVRHALKKGG